MWACFLSTFGFNVCFVIVNGLNEKNCQMKKVGKSVRRNCIFDTFTSTTPKNRNFLKTVARCNRTDSNQCSTLKWIQSFMCKIKLIITLCQGFYGCFWKRTYQMHATLCHVIKRQALCSCIKANHAMTLNVSTLISVVLLHARHPVTRCALIRKKNSVRYWTGVGITWRHTKW